jgi:hypothetical protein
LQRARLLSSHVRPQEVAVDVGVIFSSVGATKSVAELFGVIDSLDAKVDRLVRSELNAGFRNLDQARAATGTACCGRPATALIRR